MIQIYGASDDLIEIEGDIREEFGASNSDPMYISLSTGHLLKISYDGEWNIKVKEDPNFDEHWLLHEAGSERAVDVTGSDYSDLFEMDYAVAWVLCGKDFVKV